jgi:hypothetical protein
MPVSIASRLPVPNGGSSHEAVVVTINALRPPA